MIISIDPKKASKEEILEFLQYFLDSYGTRWPLNNIFCSISDPQDDGLIWSFIHSKKKQSMLTDILITILDMERDIGIVKKEDIIDVLIEKYGIGREEITNLIGSLINRGTIYSPKTGYYKINL